MNILPHPLHRQPPIQTPQIRTVTAELPSQRRLQLRQASQPVIRTNKDGSPESLAETTLLIDERTRYIVGHATRVSRVRTYGVEGPYTKCSVTSALHFPRLLKTLRGTMTFRKRQSSVVPGVSCEACGQIRLSLPRCTSGFVPAGATGGAWRRAPMGAWA